MSERKPKIRDIGEPEIKPEPPPDRDDYQYVVERKVLHETSSRAKPTAEVPQARSAIRPNRGLLAALVLISTIAMASLVLVISMHYQLSDIGGRIASDVAKKEELTPLKSDLDILRKDANEQKRALQRLQDDLKNYNSTVEHRLKDLSEHLTELDRLTKAQELGTLLDSIDAIIVPLNVTQNLYELRVYLPDGALAASAEAGAPELYVVVKDENGVAVEGSRIGPLKLLRGASMYPRVVTLEHGLYVIEIQVSSNSVIRQEAKLVQIG